MKFEYNGEITNPISNKTLKKNSKVETLKLLGRKNRFKLHITSKMMSNNCLLAAIISI